MIQRRLSMAGTARNRRANVMNAVLSVSLLLAGCGTSGEPSGETTTTVATQETTTTVVSTTTTAPPATTTLPPTTTTTQPALTTDDLWQVYTEWVEGVAIGAWDRAMELSTGPALEYVRMTTVLHEITPQDGWVFESDNGPTSEMIEIDATKLAVGGTVVYTGEAGRLEPADPVFDISGDRPLMAYWGAAELATDADRLPFSERIVVLGDRTDACDFSPLWSYIGGKGEPIEDSLYQVIIVVDVCPGSDWLPGFDEVILSTASTSGSADSVAWDSSRREDGSMPAETSSVVAVISAVEREDLAQSMTLDLGIAGESQSVTIPPMAKS